MNSQTQNGLASTALLVSLTYVPLLLSVLSFYPGLFAAHPIQHFLLGLAPWWLAYLSARWYIRLAEKSSPLYHPLGCLAQCCIWVFHSVVLLYHACFVTQYTMWTYLITVFCAGIVVITEGLFHSLITMSFSDTANLGVYEKVRKFYGKGRITSCSLLLMIDTNARLDHLGQVVVLGQCRDTPTAELGPYPQADAVQIHDNVNGNAPYHGSECMKDLWSS
ncbi:hypothetical protein J3R83DRAFT_9875 [Lanmaoa asiatica]|nr:hypothetical protein J3R83DRAFT_9875 [Lanmaoa asiatica]